MKSKVYIAGPITDVPDYKDRFKAVEEELRLLGLDPVNPAQAPEDLPYRDYIDIGLMKLMKCDMICCIATGKNPDIREWPPTSKGERLEWQYALTVGLPIMIAKAVRTEEGAKWNIEIPSCWEGMFDKEGI